MKPGTAIAVLAAVAAAGTAGYFFWWKPRQQPKAVAPADASAPSGGMVDPQAPATKYAVENSGSLLKGDVLSSGGTTSWGSTGTLATQPFVGYGAGYLS